MSLPLYVHGRSDVGRLREQNEDRLRMVRVEGGAWILVVCDGMGGHEAGEVASQLAADRIVEVLSERAALPPPKAIYEALTEANQAVQRGAQERGSPDMGTTGLVACVREGGCYVGWVGDSRLYQFRGGAQLERTQDHTRVEQMVASGQLSREQARHHPEAHILTQALQGGDPALHGFKPEVWAEPLELKQGDVLLMCSDGLYDLVQDEELYPLIAGLDYQAAVERLIATANERGGTDNVTVVVAVVGQPEVPLPEQRQVALPDGSPPDRPVAAGRRVPLWVAVLASALSLVLGLGVGRLLGSGRAPSPPERPVAAGASPPAVPVAGDTVDGGLIVDGGGSVDGGLVEAPVAAPDGGSP